MAGCCSCKQYTYVSQASPGSLGAFSKVPGKLFLALAVSPQRVPTACLLGTPWGWRPLPLLLAALAGTPLSTHPHGLHAPRAPSIMSSSLPCITFFSPSNSPLFFFPSLPPFVPRPSSLPSHKSLLGEQRRGFSLQGLLAAGALVASCTAKCLFGMQSREQPPSPPSPPQALCQWASVCEAKLQSSPGNDLPVPVQQVAGG